MTTRLVEHVVCLGCGCACDDVGVRVEGGRITEVSPTCPRGRAWFGDGTVPGAVRVDGRDASPEDALAAGAELLARARGRVLVYLGPDLSAEAQRAALGLADLLHATVDTATSSTAGTGLVAAQQRGRAAATLGEIRNRADLLLFWAVDPADRYGRFLERYVPEAGGTHISPGSRTVLSVSVGADRGPAGAASALALEPAEEVAALSVMRAAVGGAVGSAGLGELPAALRQAADMARQAARARYAVLVHDAEPAREECRDPRRIEGLIALAQALNGPTRAALVSLRAGGNRNGAEVVSSAQTGYPFAVDFARGHPEYAPGARGLARLARGGYGAALVAGSGSGLDDDAVRALGAVPTVVVGPRASEAPFTTRVAIDTGIAGIHEAGTAYRMDDLPLPLRPPLEGPRGAQDTLAALARAVAARLRKAPS